MQNGTNIRIGTKVKLKIPCLGNKINTIGICYDSYYLGNNCGVSIIFENGNYDGFSLQEQSEFLQVLEDTDLRYNFTNVMKLSEDFKRGIFSKYLKQ